VLLRFRAANVYSFRDECELNLLTRKRGESKSRFEPTRVTAIYGANASGKTNVLKAMGWMAHAVVHCLTEWVKQEGVPQPLFKLDSAAAEEASLFEVEFLLDGTRFNYGFEVSAARVETEWLFEYATGRRRTLFLRDADAVAEYDFKGRWLKGELDQITKLTRPNALFLSTAAQLNHGQLSKVYGWFLGNFLQVDGSLVDRVVPRRLLQRAAPLLALADLGIQGIDLEMGAELVHMSSGQVRLVHRGDAGDVALDLWTEESDGTRAWLAAIVDVLTALRLGGVVLFDELDASLHPRLVAELLRLFREEGTNPQGAQLICTLHDVSLLGSAHPGVPLDRREVWITDKKAGGQSELYALTDVKLATQENLERGYLRGRYGGVPDIGVEIGRYVAGLAGSAAEAG
jgi:AAA15 family ATPase/GTPase